MDKTVWRECFNYVSCKNTPTRAFYPASCVWFVVVFASTTASVLVFLHRVLDLDGFLKHKRLGGSVLITFLVKTLPPGCFIQFRVFGLLLFLLLPLLLLLFFCTGCLFWKGF